MKRNLYLIATSVIMGLAACESHKTEVKVDDAKYCLSDSMQKMIALDTAKVVASNESLQLSGEISFDENKVVKIFPRSSGQVVEAKLSLGDKVKAGDALAIVKSAEIAGNYADITSANADVVIAKRQFDNQEGLYKNGIASEKEYTEAKQNYEKAKSVKAKLESALHINGGVNSNAGGNYTLSAPINGYIVEKKVSEGNYIRPDMGDYLYTISDLRDVWVNANVYEIDIPKVKEGDHVDVTVLAYPNKIFQGTIEKLSEVLDPMNKTLRARVKLNNAEFLLKPEMFAKIFVKSKTPQTALSIPTSALIDLNGKNYVVVYKSNCDLKIAEIQVNRTVGDITFLNGGLSSGDKVIVKNQLLIFQQLLNQ
jgi:cobalt-zinc-cadmium efflux system membrane fusion protein